MNKKELLENIRRIIGNKKFTFSEAYIKQCKGTPTIGDDERNYYALTKKYLFIECWGSYRYSEEEKEWGWYFMRYPIYYRVGSGERIKKVELEDMFTKDLQKIYDDLLFFLWWEKNVHLQRVEKEYNECRKYVDIYDKIEISNEDMRKLENR